MKKIAGLYTEAEDIGNKYRLEQISELDIFIEKSQKDANNTRGDYFTPNFTDIASYNKSTEPLRDEFKKMLGYPLYPEPSNLSQPIAEITEVAHDDLGKIYRLNITVLENLTTYGLLFIPNGDGPHPLMISQHGGGGTPETCANFFGSANYNDMTRRVLRKGFAVFSPQLLLWDQDRFIVQFNRIEYDSKLKQLGSSITALEIFKLQRSLDYLLSRDDIDANRVGMIGLSYGGFYTLFTTAIDCRIKAALSSCFFNDRYKYPWADWTWFNSANKFFDVEIGALICPRPLYVEVGQKDELFDIESARDEYKKLYKIYAKLDVSNNIMLGDFNGGHELDTRDVGIEFLCSKI